MRCHTTRRHLSPSRFLTPATTLASLRGETFELESSGCARKFYIFQREGPKPFPRALASTLIMRTSVRHQSTSAIQPSDQSMGRTQEEGTDEAYQLSIRPVALSQYILHPHVETIPCPPTTTMSGGGSRWFPRPSSRSDTTWTR